MVGISSGFMAWRAQESSNLDNCLKKLLSLSQHMTSWFALTAGPKPSELYGKFTWKIENFSEISKRELRSTIFEVGSYKWYSFCFLPRFPFNLNKYIHPLPVTAIYSSMHC